VRRPVARNVSRKPRSSASVWRLSRRLTRPDSPLKGCKSSPLIVLKTPWSVFVEAPARAGSRSKEVGSGLVFRGGRLSAGGGADWLHRWCTRSEERRVGE